SMPRALWCLAFWRLKKTSALRADKRKTTCPPIPAGHQSAIAKVRPTVTFARSANSESRPVTIFPLSLFPYPFSLFTLDKRARWPSLGNLKAQITSQRSPWVLPQKP
ncbi:MAG: hypothetical protein ACOYMN_06945, partial [Roseimicrobium sp.]